MPDTNRNWDALRDEVLEWSRRNFGENESKVYKGQYLDALAPLLGMVEEAGEMMNSHDDNEYLDAVGDIMIYFLDYCGRRGVQVSQIFYEVAQYNIQQGMLSEAWDAADIPIAIGIVAHAELKRHQGIRGFDDRQKYTHERNKGLVLLVRTLSLLTRDEEMGDLIDVVAKVWDGVVSKRNWGSSGSGNA